MGSYFICQRTCIFTNSVIILTPLWQTAQPCLAGQETYFFLVVYCKWLLYKLAIVCVYKFGYAHMCYYILHASPKPEAVGEDWKTWQSTSFTKKTQNKTFQEESIEKAFRNINYSAQGADPRNRVLYKTEWI